MSTKNALTALSGFRAEDICMTPHVLQSLSQYFGKQIIKCEKIKGNKKSDICITFEDGIETTAQIKNSTSTSTRGWSFDRRSIDNIPTNDYVKELIQAVCLKNGERKDVIMDHDLYKRLMLGDDEKYKPQHFIHTMIKNGEIESLSICPANVFIDKIFEGLYENFNSKRTCVHISPLIYLQRKGGNKTDHAPNDIQAKLRDMPNCMTRIL